MGRPVQAEKRALTKRGKVEERRQDETVSIDFPYFEKTVAPWHDHRSDGFNRQPRA